MPDPAAAHSPQRLRWRLAALSLFGAAMIALPLGEVLRFQGLELRALGDRRAGLDPVTETVDVQRSLLAHRDLAADVLRGQLALEPERRIRQGQVDDGLATLALTLDAGPWERATQESYALQQDWTLLLPQIAARSLAAADSDRAHRLLLEQTLQVIDLLADATLPRAAADADSQTWTAALALPRLAAQMAALAGDGLEGDGQAREISAAEARLARTFGALHLALEAAAAGALAQHGVPALAAAAGARADQVFLLLRGGQRAQARAVTPQALASQFALFHGLARGLADSLDARMAHAKRRHRLLQAALLLLGLGAAVCFFTLWRAAARSDPDPDPDRGPVSDDHGSDRRQPGRDEAGRLLRRLRDSEERRPGRSSRRDDQPSILGNDER